MTLTDDQQTAYSAFQEFMKSDKQVFLLKGSAGSGKTTLLKVLIDLLPKNSDNVHENWEFCLMAPTGRAAMILRKKTGYDNARTIHSIIYKKSIRDKNNKLFFCLSENTESLNTVYFIDESSMISDIFNDNELLGFGSGFLLNDLIKYCEKRKIVFVGDYAQLPPIGQNFSPALDADYLKEKYNLESSEVIMRHVVRQVETSEIYQNALKIRNAIEQNIFNEFSITDGKDVILSQNILEDYKKITKGKIDDSTIVITFSNVQALNYNLSIRNILFKPEEKKRLNPNDLLIISQNNYLNGLDNGTIVKVLSCDDDNHLESRTVRFYTKERNTESKSIVKEIRLDFRKVTIKSKEKTISCLILDNFLTDEFGQISKDLLQALLTDFNNRIPKDIKCKSESYYSFLENDPYYNAIICKFGYAITCHKAQGGEWENVLIDMNKFGEKQNNTYFRWAYTAITRSNGKLWHFASPDFNAISKMVVNPITKGGNIIYYVPKNECFLDWRFRKIKEICSFNNVSCIENRSKPYQHIIMFSDTNKHFCTLQLWYNKNSYNGKINTLRQNNNNFTKFMLRLCEQSIIPNELPFEPHSAFAKKLHEHIISISKELDTPIINIRQEQWHDIYYLKTNAEVALLSFYYNSKGIYTHVIPQSSNGENDELLKLFCEKL